MAAIIKSTPSPAILARIKADAEAKRGRALRAQARRPAEPLRAARVRLETASSPVLGKGLTWKPSPTASAVDSAISAFR